uniref:BTB domain-containing protein n=3 Tax=Cucumis melo TaxID=3656 RepID=A0A9I9CUZ3_CUCME
NRKNLLDYPKTKTSFSLFPFSLISNSCFISIFTTGVPTFLPLTSSMKGVSDPSLIRLNIGGKKFRTTLDTLTLREPDSMLAAMFSGRHTLCQDPEEGSIFLDRDGKHFRHILNWLRDGIVPFLSDFDLLELLREAEYYQLLGLMDRIRDLLSNRKEDEEPQSELKRVDIIKCIQSEKVRLRGVNLCGLDLSKLDLSYVDFSYASLKNVFFSRANLQCAKFRDADAEGSIFHNATLRECEFTGANLRGALLAAANLQSANLQDACLVDCSFCGADLRSAHLQGADLTNANLEGANLEGANLKGAKLLNANLRSANLQRAYLRYVNLRDTQLEGARLDGANLLGAIR